MKPSLTIGMLLFCFFAAMHMAVASETTSMRCNGSVISVGDSKADVLTKCGEPIYKEKVGHQTTGRVTTGLKSLNSAEHEYEETETDREEWLMNVGSGQFFRVLTFEGSELVKIEKTKERAE